METKPNYRELVSQKEFIKLVIANVINRFGDSVDAIAFSWLLFQLTGKASLMAINLLLNILPTVLLQPIAGAIVDRIRKRNVMVLMDLGRGITVAVVAATALTGHMSVIVLMAMTLVNSILEALRVPAGIAFFPRVIAKDQYTTGIALNHSASRISEIAGTAIAGVLIATVGGVGALVIDAATFFLSAVIIARIRVQEEKPAEKVSFANTKSGLVEGVRYVKNSKQLLAILIFGMVLNALAVPLLAFRTPYAIDFLHAKPQFLSFAELASLAGMAIGALLVPKIKMTTRKILLTAGIVGGISLMLFFVFPLVRSTAAAQMMAVANMAVMGIISGILTVVFSAMLVKHVDSDFLGRVGGLTNAVLCSAMPLMSLLCSGLALLLPVTVIMLVFGVLTIVVYIVMTRFSIYNEL